jgi:hypothetical protein
MAVRYVDISFALECGDFAIISVPSQMTENDFKHLQDLLGNWKSALTLHAKAAKKGRQHERDGD